MSYINKNLDNKLFEVVPGFEMYSITRDGVIIKTGTDEVCTLFIDFNGYYRVKGGTIRHQLHRFLGLTFLPIPERYKDIPLSKLQINHIDGNKLNNDLSNLEWCTAQENCIHALKNGLRTDNHFLLCKNYFTGEIKEYFSIRECARNINIHPGNVHRYLTKMDRTKTLLKATYVIIRKDMEDWPKIDEEAILFKNEYGLTDWAVYDPDEKILTLLGSGADVVKYLNISTSSFEKKYRQSKLNKTYSFEINGKFVTPYANFREASKEIKEKIDRRKEAGISLASSLSVNRINKQPIPIEVTDLKTGDVKLYPSSEVFSKILNINKKTFQRYINTHNGIWKNKYKIRYLRNNKVPS